MNKKHRFRYRLPRLCASRPLEKYFAEDPVRVDFLLPGLDRGEAEALLQTREKAARHLIVDDRGARRVATNMGLQPVRTLSLLARMELEGHCGSTSQLVARLRRDLQFRVTAQVVADALREARRPI